MSTPLHNVWQEGSEKEGTNMKRPPSDRRGHACAVCAGRDDCWHRCARRFHAGNNSQSSHDHREDSADTECTRDSRPPRPSIWHSHPAWSPPQRTACAVRCDSVQLPTSDHRKTTQLLLRGKRDAISKYLQRGPNSPVWVTILEAAALAWPSLHETATSWETLSL